MPPSAGISALHRLMCAYLAIFYARQHLRAGCRRKNGEKGMVSDGERCVVRWPKIIMSAISAPAEPLAAFLITNIPSNNFLNIETIRNLIALILQTSLVADPSY